MLDRPLAAWSRALILDVRPAVDCGRWPLKRIAGDAVTVTAAIVADGHDLVAAAIRFGPVGGDLGDMRMAALGNDRYTGTFTVGEPGRYTYQVRAWVDQFGTWRDLFRRRVAGGSPAEELASELLEGAALLEVVAARGGPGEARLRDAADRFRAGDAALALDPEVGALAADGDPGDHAAESQCFAVHVERERAQFGAWYAFFARSTGTPGTHGTLDDAAARLPAIKALGFDVAYLLPIHPIGSTARKGKNNSAVAGPDDVGSVYAIGSADGGHLAVEPRLGGLPAFDRFMARARELDLEVALDLAYNCSPDHPWVREHPDWFRHRPDGSIRSAENPPKRYQDVYPLDFESPDWPNLWVALREIVAFWAARGVRIFRVDNPHTKALPFWEWAFRTLREQYPDLIFLAEAFTRPQQLYALAKLGFSQSYTYFTWRHTKRDFEEYLSELFQTEVVEFFRPSFWPNTPDILPPHLRSRAAFQLRLVMAATMSASYGIYGPAFELLANVPHPDREEYLDNEKYEIRSWDHDAPHSLAPLIARVNAIRAAHPALRDNRSFHLHPVDNEQLLAFSKQVGENRILVVINFDETYAQSGFIEVDLAALGLSGDSDYIVEDLLTGERYPWRGARNYVRLDPEQRPAHILSIEA
jgi:starch synthase (maltosyl-transferring)